MKLFSIEKKMRGKLGRAGKIETPHGIIETPAFVVVGTKATVKSLTPEMLAGIGAQVVLGNTFHLYLEPGEKIVARAGGLGKFMGWNGPTMTDSGGFQIFSLGAAFDGRESKFFNGHRVSIKNTDDKGEKKSLVRVDEDGVSFTSPLDGSKHRFTPEKSIEIQHKLGADIIFAFDECASPSAPYEYQKKAMERTHRWAIRSLETHQKASKVLWPSLAQRDGASRAIRQQANMRVRPQELCELFGIIQGGRHEDLRKESARVISKMLVRRSSGEGGDFDGFGIGGSFDKEDVGKSVKLVNEILPEEKPRHLLGIGGVEDLFSAVENGCDSFDCVAPTREARTGSLYTSRGRINITNARFRNDFTPLDKNCECCTCKNFTRAYLSHLFRSKELLAYTLASIHNLHFFISLVKDMRASIIDGKFEKYKKDFLYNFNT